MLGAPHAVEVHALERRFGRRRALDGVDFTLDGGECLAIFGPNGAGKTTLLRVLAGLLKPTSGVARIAGISGGGAARAAVGLISHQSMLYTAMTARENVLFAARIYRVASAAQASDAALSRMRALDCADTPVRLLSRGMQQRVSIARAIVHGPRVLLLDEPFTGLDDTGATLLSTELRALRDQGSALVLVTHNIAGGLALATHAATLIAGRFVRFDVCASVDSEAYVTAYRELASLQS